MTRGTASTIERERERKREREGGKEGGREGGSGACGGGRDSDPVNVYDYL